MYHPLVAFDGLTGDFLKAELRSGNVYTSNGVGAFVKPLFEHFNQVVPVSNILVRGDNGFATPELYDLCEAYDSFFVIRLRANRNLSKLGKGLFRLTTTILGIKKKSFILQHPTKQKSGPKNVGSVLNPHGKQMNYFSDMNTSSLITQIMSLRKQSFGLTANAAPWKTSSKRQRMAFISIRPTALPF